MNAMLVIKTKNGYAVAPYAGDVPAAFVQNMSVASKISSYSYSTDTVVTALEAHFEQTGPEPARQTASDLHEEPL